MQTNELMTELGTTIAALMAPGKGLLAADESNTTIAARFRPFAIRANRGQPAPRMGNELRLTRSELYELIWSEPMSTLAPKYGLSNVGMAKWIVPRLRAEIASSRQLWTQRGSGSWREWGGGKIVEERVRIGLCPYAHFPERSKPRIVDIDQLLAVEVDLDVITSHIGSK